MKQESIKSLQGDLEFLIGKHSNLIHASDFNQALNVMKNIDNLSSQLKRLDYEKMVSKFSIPELDGKLTRLISIWNQNSFGDIKDVETYYLGERYEENMGECLEKLSKNWNTMSQELKDNFLSLFGKKDKVVAETIVKKFNCVANDEENKWYDVLKFFIETEQSQLIQLNYSDKIKNNQHRGTGKSAAIVRLANDFNIPIYTNKSRMSFIQDKCKEFNIHPLIIDDINKLSLAQYKSTKIILVDEMTDIDNIDRSNYIIIGFANYLSTIK